MCTSLNFAAHTQLHTAQTAHWIAARHRRFYAAASHGLTARAHQLIHLQSILWGVPEDRSASEAVDQQEALAPAAAAAPAAMPGGHMLAAGSIPPGSRLAHESHQDAAFLLHKLSPCPSQTSSFLSSLTCSSLTHNPSSTLTHITSSSFSQMPSSHFSTLASSSLAHCPSSRLSSRPSPGAQSANMGMPPALGANQHGAGGLLGSRPAVGKPHANRQGASTP